MPLFPRRSRPRGRGRGEGSISATAAGGGQNQGISSTTSCTAVELERALESAPGPESPEGLGHAPSVD